MAERRFTVRLDAEMNINQVKTATQDLQAELSKLSLPDSVGEKLSKTFTQLNREIETFQTKAASGIGSSKDFTSLESSVKKIIQTYEQLRQQITGLGNLGDSQLSKMFPESAIDNIKKAEAAYKEYEASIKKNNTAITNQTGKINQQKKTISELEQQIDKVRNKPVVSSQKELTALGDQAVEAQKDFEALQKQSDEVKSKIEQLSATLKRPEKSVQIKRLQEQLQELAPKTEEAKQKWEKLLFTYSNTTTIGKQTSEIQKLEAQLNAAKGDLTTFTQELAKMQAANPAALQTLITSLNQIPGINLDSATASLTDIKQAIAGLSSSELEKLKASFQQAGSQVNNTKSTFDQLGKELDQTRGKVSQLDSQMGEVDMLKSRVQYFFGLTNSVYLLRNALRSALETVKELDAVMTETAVVTDFSIGDMWEKLPQYAEEASNLGAEVKDLYSATTLYYQQGLKSQQAMSVGIETMKMARIASMEAEEATQAMTAALRGFNMTVNETNALRVNDVYSELAAITAADTAQIATAMTKTASIAYNANMEFETTAALLAQIIETTQEAPETAGTALKTIIARFSEVKELYSKGLFTGEDEEGEIIDVNKISVALGSVGISMNGFFAGVEGLDSVLLKLAEKWDKLDFSTQRYIATTAAGSRQQSRFIAMMSDYERTQELVTAANTSAGASQEQFNKTLESMSAKLANLENAWNEFTMGIANNELIKTCVDLLQGLLNIINELTSALPGPLDGFAKIALILVGLRLGGKIFDAFFVNLKACGAPAAALSKTLAGVGTSIKRAFSKGTYAFDKKMFIAKGAVSQYTRAQNEYNIAITQSAALEKQGAKAATEKAAADKNAEIAKEQMTLAEKKYMAAMGLSNAQTAEAIGFTQLGISADVAAMAAAEGLTMAELTKAAVTKLGAEATEEEIKAEVKRMLTEQFSDKVTKKTLTTRIAETAQTMLNTLAKWGLVPANTAAAFSEKVLGNEAMATGVKMLISLGIIGLIIAAVMLLIAGIIALVKHMRDNTPEAKMKALEESAKKAAEAAEEAKNEFEELMSSIEEYKNIRERIEELEKGTLDWAQAIKEANEQVLQLIKNYPVLSNYMSMSEQGILQISEQGFEVIRNLEMEELAIANGVAGFAELNVQKGRANNVLDQFREKAITDTSQFNIQYSEAAGGEVSNMENSTKQQNQTRVNNMINSYLKGELSALWSSNAKTVISEEDAGRYINSQGITYGLSAEGIQMAESLGYSQYELRDELEGEIAYKYSPEIVQLAEEFGLTGQELYALRDSLSQYGSQYKVLIAQQEAYSKALVASTLSQNVLNSSYGSGITQNLGKVLTPERIQQIRDTKSNEWKDGTNWNNSDSSTNDNLKAKIAEFNTRNPEKQISVTGDERTDMKAYYEALSGQEWTSDDKYDDDELSAAIAEAEAAREVNDIGDQLYNLTVSNHKAGQLMKGDLDTEYTGDATTTFGLDANNANDQVIIEALEQAYSDIQTKRAEINSELSNIFGGTGDAIAQFGSYKQAEKFLSGYNSLVLMAGETAGSLFAETFSAYASAELGADRIESAELLEEFSKVNWTSAIQGAAGLKDMLENGSVAAKDFALNMIALKPAAYSATAQFNELYAILGQEALADLAKDGEITASEIQELSKESKDVATVLDTTGISASTLGTYFEMLENGALSAAEATDIFIQSLEKLNAASNTISETFAFLDNFEASKSQTDIGAGFQEIQEEITKLYDLGAYGDQRLIDYVKQFIGEEDWGELVAEKGGSVKAALDEIMPMVQSYGSNLYGLWEQFAGLDNGGMVSLGANGAIDFNLEQIGTVDQLKQQLMSQLNISEVVANAMIADAQTFSEGLSQGLNSLSLQDALGTWLSGALDVNGKKIISENQLKAFAEEAGLDPAILEKAIEESDLNIDVKPYIDYDGNLEEELYDVIIQQLESTGDLSATYALMLELGMDDTIAKQTLTKMTNQLHEAGKDVPFTVNGKQLQATGEVVDGVMKYSTQDGSHSGTMGGIIDGLQDPAVAAQQDLSALRQAQVQAEATAVGVSTATGAVIGGTLNGVVDWANSFLGYIGIHIDSFDTAGYTQGLINGATTASDAHFNSKLADAQMRFDNAKAASSTPSGASVESIISNYQANAGTTENGSTSAYTGGSSQTEYKGDEDSKWENSYDEYYNSVKKINAELRKRESLERQYQRLLERNSATATDLVKNQREQLANLKTEKGLREALLNNRNDQMAGIEAEYSDLQKYAWYDEKLGQVQIDWSLLEGLDGSTDEDLTSRIEDYISKLEEQQDLIEQEKDELEEINDGVWEIYNQGKDEYFSLEDQIKEAIVSNRQREIDELTKINETINDTNSQILDGIQSQIDEQRQSRENQKTEKEISDKQQRLAYLQQDSSGANALEILELQKEIEEAQEDYTDTLIDQKVSELQLQNEEAARQRERQIEILQKQLDSYVDSGQIWQEVNRLMNEGLDPTKGLITGSQLETLLKSEEGFKGLSSLQQMNWMNELNKNIASALSWLETGAMQSLFGQGKEVAFKNADGELVKGVIDSNGDVKVTGQNGENYLYSGSTFKMSSDGSLTSTQKASEAKIETSSKPAASGTQETSDWRNWLPSKNEYTLSKGMKNSKAVSGLQWALQQLGLYQDGEIDGSFGGKTEKAVKEFQKEATEVYFYNGKIDGKVGPKTREAFRIFGYKTGGLADFTGPAWLDGTKSKPEYILNADQTKAFFTLVDVLSGLQTKPSKTTEKSGDNNYDIDINVESIGNDYDVEQLAGKVKDIILSSSRYRNTNSL